MSAPHTISAHELPLVESDGGRSDGFVKPRLARLLADALEVDLAERALPIQLESLPAIGAARVGPSTKAPRGRPRKELRRVDDDDDEREADAEAASIGPAPPPPPAGSQHLLSHTLILTVPPPPAEGPIGQRQAVETNLERLRFIFDEADPGLLATEGLPLGRGHLDFSVDDGPLLLLQPPVLPPRPTPRSWSSPSHKKQTLLYLSKVGADLGSAQADKSSFVGKQKSERSWIAALSYLASPATRPDDGSPPRFVATATLSLHPTPDPSSALSHAVHLKLDVYMTPAVFASAETVLVAEAQRRLLTDILPAPADPAAYATHGGHTTIPFFFETLQPAPESGNDEAARAELATHLHPPGLELELLPFQARTVRWLLKREGVRLAGPARPADVKGKGKARAAIEPADVKMEADVKLEDDVKSEDDSDAEIEGLQDGAGSSAAVAAEDAIRPAVALLPARHAGNSGGASWAYEAVELPLPPPALYGATSAGNDDDDDADPQPMAVDETAFYFNRLSGELLRSEADVRLLATGGIWDVDAQPGGMLCEEMGLGKTIEVMALLLLHPSPASRSRIVQSSTAEVTATRCRQVKATLIVSPESLITQWKDELEGHSPGLRVLVYNGYKSLPFKISTSEEIERIREERALRKQQARRWRYHAGLDDDEDDEDEDFRAASATSRLKRKSSSSKGKGRAGGRKRARSNEENDDAEGDESLWWRYLAEDGGYDVVLCSYATLERDFSVAAQPKQRPRRGGVDYNSALKPRSPLVMCEWWRIAMDEVQLSGRPRIEDMVSLLPRVNSLAVSGTPAKAKVEDLRSTLQFLRQFPVAYFPRLVEPGFAITFEKLFQRIATRTTKAKVNQELTIPPQTRVLIPIDLTPIELAYYESTFSRCLDELHFDIDGNGFELNVALARNWVYILRQISTHPQIGGLGGGHAQRERQQDRRLNLGENLLSMADVLNKMLDSNAADVAMARRTLTEQQINHAQLLVWKVEAEHGKVPDTNETRNDPRRIQARELLLLAAEETARDLLELVPAADAAEAAEAESEYNSDAGDVELSEEQRRARQLRNNAIGRARLVRMLRHRALFLLGDWSHVAQDEATETSYYEQAAQLRQVLHGRPQRVADGGIARLKRKLSPDTVTTADLEIPMPDFSQGIQTARAVEAARDVLKLLFKNGELVNRWRTKLLSMLSKGVEEPFEDPELVAATVDMDEYQTGAVVQGIIDDYLQAYVTALSDRRELLDGHRDQLAVLELRPGPRKNIGPVGASRLQTLNGVDRGDDVEELDLGRKLMRERAKHVLNPSVVSRARPGRPPLKTYMHDMITTAQISNSSLEVQIASQEGKRLKALIKNQLTAVERLMAESKIFEGIYNLRITYFMDKQTISDSVAELNDHDLARQWDKRVDVAIRKQKEASAKIGGLVSRSRFLKHMDAVYRGDGAVEEHTCAICLDEGFTKGVLFTCSHLLCAQCWQLLMRKSPRGPACPTCREPINPSQVNRIILSAADVDRIADGQAPNGKGKASKGKGKGKGKAVRREIDRLAAFNVFDLEERREISQESILGTWGSKIDFLVKHLLYLAVHDRGYKAIVFSAFSDGLNIIQRALTENGIPYSAASSTNIRTVAHDFKADDTKRVFLLHGERESSGLTLTCAKYIWMLEPCVAPSFELQAVGRVDRMGQKQETKVFCLFGQNTVDESIVHLQVAKGTSIYLKSAAGTSMPTFSTLPDDGKVEGKNKNGSTKKGDFVAKSDDLAALLFPDRHLFGLPTEADIVELSDSSEGEQPVSAQETVARRQLDGMVRADAAERRAERSEVDGLASLAAEAGPGPSSVAARLDRILADQEHDGHANST